MKKLLVLALTILALSSACITIKPSGSTDAPSPELAGGQLPVINSFDANPGSIVSGQTSTLSWNVTGATTVSIDHAIGSVGTTGSRAVSPTTTTTYTLTATNSAGSVTKAVQVIVSTATPITPTLTIIKPVENDTWVVGSTITIKWQTTGMPSEPVVVDMGMSTGQGAPWIPFAGNEPNDGSYQSTVADIPDGTYLIGIGVRKASSAPGNNLAFATVPVIIQPGATKTVTLDYEATESGHVYSDDAVEPYIRAGDFHDNTIARGYVSFDISSLAGYDVTSAELTFYQADLLGDPFGYGPLGLSEVRYGPRGLIPADYDLATVNNLPPSNTGTGSIDVTQFVKQAVVQQLTRFQVRFRFPFGTDNDGQIDRITLDPVTLEVTYR